MLFCRDGRVMWRTRQAETPWQPAGEWSEWEEIGGGAVIASGVVNQNGTISFYDTGGNLLFTTTGTNIVTSGNQQIGMGYDNGGFYFLFDDGQEAG